jgi:peptide/nickel transport system substrate-binding protein
VSPVPGTRFWQIAGACLVLVIVLTACGQTADARRTATGGIVTFAEQADTPPNYIFPLESGSYFEMANDSQFSSIMYVPLYWFGDQGKPVLNKSLSVARPPVFSVGNTVATITLKHWVWSNGQPITARDVIFWMNLLTAVTDPNAPAVGSASAPGPGWGIAVPGSFPYNVRSYAQTGTYTLVLHLNRAYNPTWFTYNELSQIYPLPRATWDRLTPDGPVGSYDASAQARVALPHTSPTQYVPAQPGTATSGALGVAQFLNAQSQDVATYTTNPLWRVVDGSFKLSQFTTSGFVKMVPNPSYSGSPKAKIRAFEELPFTSDSAEFDALETGSLTIGYIPTQDLGQRRRLEQAHGYRYSSWNFFGFDFSGYNFTSPSVGAVFRQLYFRQAFQSLINQPQYIADFASGTGSITNGPVPSDVKGSPYISPALEKGQLYPYDPATAVRALKQHGWTVVPGGLSFCAKVGAGPDQCGRGVRQGQKAQFSLIYTSGSTELTSEMATLASTMKREAGIDITLSSAPHAQVLGIAFTGCYVSAPCKNWELVDFGAPWIYSPANLPTGEELYASGAASDVGGYSNPTMDADIEATETAPTQAAEVSALFRYEDFVAKQLPDWWVPTGPYQLTMYKSDLHGLLPQGINTELYPQYYSLRD